MGINVLPVFPIAEITLGVNLIKFFYTEKMSFLLENFLLFDGGTCSFTAHTDSFKISPSKMIEKTL